MRILMVCLGNICRSPLAEGILRNKLTNHPSGVEVDSAGTGAWHAGETPDKRAIRIAKKYHVDISGLRARQFNVSDFDELDKIFVMDQSNERDVLALARNASDKSKVQLFLSVNPSSRVINVPDPWYGGEEGFEKVYKMLEAACEALIIELGTKEKSK